MLQIQRKTRGSNYKMVQIQLKLQLPAPKRCKWPGKRAKKQIRNKFPQGKTIIPKTIPDPYFLRITISI